MMLRRLFRPRRWWLLAVPFFFYLSREVVMDDEYAYLHGPVSVMDYEASQFQSRATAYRVFELSTPITPNSYFVLRFIANACLVIGGIAVAKQLYFPDPEE